MGIPHSSGLLTRTFDDTVELIGLPNEEGLEFIDIIEFIFIGLLLMTELVLIGGPTSGLRLNCRLLQLPCGLPIGP